MSAIVSGAGFIGSFWTNLDKEVRAQGGDDQAIYEAMKEGSPLFDQFAKLIVRNAKPRLLEHDWFTCVVNYDQSVQYARAAAKCTWPHEPILGEPISAEHFATHRKGSAQLSIMIVSFNRTVTDEEGHQTLHEMNYRPTELHELLALAEQHRDFPLPLFAPAPLGREKRPYPYLHFLQGSSDVGLSMGLLSWSWEKSSYLAVTDLHTG